MRRRKKPSSNDTNFLSRMVLLKNDPEYTREIKHLAQQGNNDAQYALGLIYAEGRGVRQDEIESYYWLSHAKNQGDEDAELLLQIVQQSMSLQEISFARKQIKLRPLTRDESNA